MTSINARPETVRAVGNAIGRAALFDDRITEGDSARIAAWAEAVERHHLDAEDLLDAVTSYYSTPRERAILVGDLIHHARNARQDRAQRDNADTAAAAPLPPADPQLGGLPIDGANGRAIPEAYEINDAISRKCPTCRAPEDHYCRNLLDTNRTRKIPCLRRMKPIERTAASSSVE